MSSPALEEGTARQIDFGKLCTIGERGHQVVPVVLQNADDGAVLFVGYANELALQETLSTGRAVLFSSWAIRSCWRGTCTRKSSFSPWLCCIARMTISLTGSTCSIWSTYV